MRTLALFNFFITSLVFLSFSALASDTYLLPISIHSTIGDAPASSQPNYQPVVFTFNTSSNNNSEGYHCNSEKVSEDYLAFICISILRNASKSQFTVQIYSEIQPIPYTGVSYPPNEGYPDVTIENLFDFPLIHASIEHDVFGTKVKSEIFVASPTEQPLKPRAKELN